MKSKLEALKESAHNASFELYKAVKHYGFETGNGGKCEIGQSQCILGLSSTPCSKCPLEKFMVSFELIEKEQEHEI